MVFCARSIARRGRVSNWEEELLVGCFGPSVFGAAAPTAGCSWPQAPLAMVSGVLRRGGARDPHAREWFGSCSRYRRRLERGRRTSGGVMLGYRVSTSTCRLLAPLLYAGLDALVTYFLRHSRPSQFRATCLSCPLRDYTLRRQTRTLAAFLWGPAGAGCVGYLVVR